MSMYESFAEAYDAFMDNIPYDEWEARLTQILREHGVSAGTVADLGCGTGTLTEALAAKGYDMIGVDASVDMLMIAQNKKAQSGSDILYLEQDIRELSLGSTVQAVICACDTINYLENLDDVKETFARVMEHLEEGGVFVFDVKTPHLYRDVMADNTFAYNLEDSAFIWENFWDEDTRENEYDLAIFLQEESGLFRRYDEVHVQHAFELEDLKKTLEATGFTVENVYDDYTEDAVNEESERWVFVAHK